MERGPRPPGPFTIRFELPYPVRARLDRLLAGELGVPRARLGALVRSAVDLTRPVRDGLEVTLGILPGPGVP